MRVLTLFFICFSLTLSAQFQDNFSDGDFTSNPTWEGEGTKFSISDTGELQLTDEAASSPAYLFTRLNLTDETVWECYFRQEFAPSSSNFSRIYLSSDSEDLTADLNGYFLKLGGITGSDDALELYRQTGAERELLATGTVGKLGATNNQAHLRITRNNTGSWIVEADYDGGENFQEEARVVDLMHPIGNIFGITCTYTSSRSDKFFFDDFSIMPLSEDITAPQLLRVDVMDAQHLSLYFNENIEAQLAEDLNNYRILPTIAISNATRNGTRVDLVLETPLQEGITYTIEISEVADLNGNTAANISGNFFYTPPIEIDRGDIIINEIFADPSPAIGLPELEFIELYNRTSDKYFDLKDFILADLAKDIDLPEFILAPNSYVVLYKAGLADFSIYGDALALSDFLTLGNSGDALSLLSPEGDLIDDVNYDDSWYQNTAKDDGGWTLERINPNLLCDRSASNWRASEHPTGGTPAQQNSVYNPVLDDSFVGINRVFLVGDDQLSVLFDEVLDEASATDISNYEIEGVQIVDAQLENFDATSVLLLFDAPIDAGRTYTLQLTGLTDCLGNTVSNSRADFALPALPEENDIIINEILFNPVTGGSDFVELYNRSDKVIDLRDLFLANKEEGEQLDNIKRITTSYLLFPASYVVLTSNPEDLKMRYATENPRAFVQMSLPSLPNTKGTLVLYRLDENVTLLIDGISYLDDWHSNLLDDEDGVSLERIHPDAPTHMPSSWHSASAAVGYATPTYQNSQFFEEKTATKDDVFFLPESTFSPDSDGNQDFLLINYVTDRVGYLATIRLFDEQGRLIKHITANEILGTSGTFKWDGSTDEGVKTPLGIYIVSVDYFTPEGNRQIYQSTCVVAGRLN